MKKERKRVEHVTRFTAEKKEEFLNRYRELGTITAACEALKMSRRCYYFNLERDQDFAAKVKEVEKAVAESLEQEAMRRAYAGSDTLLIFLLKGHMPDKYKERFTQEITGKDGGPLEIVFNAAKVPGIDAPK